MPTYQNITNKPIHLEYDDTVINPGETKEVYSFYNKDGLRLIDVNPYKTPVKLSETVDSSTDTKSYDVLGYGFTIVAKSDIQIHYNEDPCDNPTILTEGSVIHFTNAFNLINSIYIKGYPDGNSASFYIMIYDTDYVRF